MQALERGFESFKAEVEADLGVSGKVLITGVSGYLGSWCMQKCLEAGFFVVGTVRDPDSSKCAFLKEAIEGKSQKITEKAKTNLKLVKADLLSGDDVWDRVFKENDGIEYVLHTASPFFGTEPENPDDMLKPAIHGTTCVVKAAVNNGVKRIVVTSSFFAIWEPVIDGKTYTPADWSDPDVQATYGKSKTLAEKAAWEAVKGSKTELSVVNPMFITGPTLYTDKSPISGFESGSIVTKICTGNLGMVPNIMMALTDVRDVAKAHLFAMTKPGAGGKRFICSKEPHWFQEIQSKFARVAGVKAAGKVPSCCFGCLVLCLPEAKGVKKGLDKSFKVDAKQTEDTLGFKFRDEAVTVQEMCDDFARLGVYIKK